MSEIRASYKRSFQVKPYETETVELSIADTFTAVGGGADGLAAVAAEMHRSLTEVGDAIVADRMRDAPKVPNAPAKKLNTW